jgi:uncharacterized protein YgbK (DUF1537 family)
LPKDLGINKERNGGLIVVGSYVPKTTKQVEMVNFGEFYFFLSSDMLISVFWFVLLIHRLKSLNYNVARA